MKRNHLNQPLIYTGLLLVVGWFGSQGCFPVSRSPVPVISSSPCPANSQGQPTCPSPAPSNAPAASNSPVPAPSR